jgi:hypothetical protein
LFYVLSLKHVLAGINNLFGYPSWLYFGKIGGQYGVVIDEAAARSKFLREEDVQRFRLYLYFHELGHMVLHRNDLWNRKTQHDPTWYQGGKSNSQMELEADVAARMFGYGCGRIIFPEEYFFKEPTSQ